MTSTRGPSQSVPGEILYDLGMVDAIPANNAPKYLYRPNPERPECDHTVELPIRETYLWCPLCALEGHHSQLKRTYLAPAMQQVWWEHWNPTTGQVESDRKRMQHHLNQQADEVSEKLGIAHEFHRNDFTALRKEAEAQGKDTQTPLRSTHDRAVAAGTKESKGRFVHDL